MTPIGPLAGQVAVVTGASAELGAAIASALAAEGCDLALAGRRPEKLHALAEAARLLGRRVEVKSCDVTDEADVAAFVKHIADRFDRRIDILVNVAGGTGSLDVPLWEIPGKRFSEVLALNLTATFLTMAAVMPLMMARRSGRIVNIGGTYGLRGRAGRAAYSAAKWGLRGLTKTAAIEAGPFNVTINCVCPGLVEGTRLDEAVAKTTASGVSTAEARDRLVKDYPLRRASTPADIAAAVIFLAGEGARQITGQDLAVDGGWAM